MKVCSVDGCDRTAWSRGWCKSHYQRWQRNGEPGPADFRPIRAVCQVQGCGEPHEGRGWCATHYMRWKQKGDPLPEKAVQTQVRTRRYSEHEMAYISDLSLTAEQVADQIGVHRVTVARIRRHMNFESFELSNWLESDTEFVVEHIDTMHTREIAEALGRPTAAVQTEITRLRKGGLVATRGLERKYGVRDKWLLAKTCPDCGLFLDAWWFPKKKARNGKEYYWPNCRKCRVEYKHKAGDDQRAKWKKSVSKYQAKLQAYTQDRAENAGKEWTEADIKVLQDSGKTVLQKALTLKRSYAATMTALCKAGLTSKPELPTRTESEWKVFWEFEDYDLEAVAS